MDYLEHYWKLADSERGFNESQAGIRTLASGWILAGVGAVGVLLSSGSDWLVARSTLVVILCTLAVAGLATLWIIDQLVFHRLLNAVFLVGLKMEYDDGRLPPIRAMMMLSAERKGMHRWQRLFYLTPMLAFASVSLLVIITAFGQDEQEQWTPWVNWGLVVVQGVFTAWVLRKQEAIRFDERAVMFGSEGFSQLVHAGKYEEIIRAHSTAGQGRDGLEES